MLFPAANHDRNECSTPGCEGGDAERRATVRPVRYLVLWLTTACNLHCAYCYRGEQRVARMSFAVAEAALRLAGASGLPFHVQLTGGEPTLEPELIEFAGRMVREIRWPATLALQTNGTLLDTETIELCKRYRIDVCLSIDGPPAIQERVRGGVGAVFHGLHLLARREMVVRVTSVLSDVNVGHLRDLILCLGAFPNVRGVALDALVRKGNAVAGTVREPTEAAVRAGVPGMLEALRQVNRLRPVPISWRECDAVARVLKMNVATNVYCHACLGESLAVHPDGTVYPCSQAVGDRAMEAGTVDRVDWVKLRDIYRGVALRGDCGDCRFEGRCLGDCPSRIIHNSEGMSPKVVCTVYRTIADWVAAEEMP